MTCSTLSSVVTKTGCQWNQQSKPPASILILMELVRDLLPAGVVNMVNAFGTKAGEALATSKRITKIAFTGLTPVREVA